MSERRLCSECGHLNSPIRLTCKICRTPLAAVNHEARVRCPYCAEEILAAAKKCRHCQAWTDGRDLEATPPLTVENINVWDAASRSAAVCRVKHGQQVETLAAERNHAENRWYVKVRGSSCTGWLPEDWLSKQPHPAVGDRF